MLDIGWSELLVIGVVALIVIGPKDLPDMFRTLGRFTAKLRIMARDFQRAMETAANESGVKDVAKDLRAMTSPQSLGLNAMKDAAAKFEKWDPLKPKPTVAPTPDPDAPKPAAPKPAAPKPAATTATLVSGKAKPMGPATTALAAKQAERKAIAADAGAKLRRVADPAASVTPPPPAAKAATAVRSKAVKSKKPLPTHAAAATAGKVARSTAAKPARKPAKSAEQA